MSTLRYSGEVKIRVTWIDTPGKIWIGTVGITLYSHALKR